VRGHIKRYSELVSENGVELLAQYSAMTKPVMPDLTQLPKATRHADPRKLVLPSLVVLIAFAAVGTVWWILENIQSTPAAAPQAVPTSTEESSVPTDVVPGVESAPPAPIEAPPVASAETPPPAAVAPPAIKTPPPPAARVTRGVPGTPPPRAGTTAGAVSAAQISKASLARAAAAAAGTSRARSVSVTLKFVADSWVEVYDANGQRLFYDIGSANSSHALNGTPPLRVVLGNAPAVSLNINGKNARVPASVMQDSGAQFTINRSGRIVRTRPDGG
jgi:cytoskeleton protein RodZ